MTIARTVATAIVGQNRELAVPTASGATWEAHRGSCIGAILIFPICLIKTGVCPSNCISFQGGSQGAPGVAPQPPGLQDLAANGPGADLAGKSARGLNGHDPPHRLNDQAPEEDERHSCEIPLCSGFNPYFPNICPAFCKPPRQKVIFLNPFFLDGMVDYGSWFVSQALSRLQKAASKFTVLIAKQAVATPAQIGTKQPASVKNAPAECHIRTKAWLGQVAWDRAGVEHGKRGHRWRPIALEPRRRNEPALWVNRSSRSGPLTGEQRRGQIIEPGVENDDVVISEGEYLAQGLAYSSIAGMGQALV